MVSNLMSYPTAFPMYKRLDTISMIYTIKGGVAVSFKTETSALSFSKDVWSH